MPIGDAAVIDRGGLDQLIAALHERGYRVLGPVVRDQAISIDELHGADDLPEGWHDTQSPGHYRLQHGDDPALFAWAVGQDSIKPAPVAFCPFRGTFGRSTIKQRLYLARSAASR